MIFLGKFLHIDAPGHHLLTFVSPSIPSYHYAGLDMPRLVFADWYLPGVFLLLFVF